MMFLDAWERYEFPQFRETAQIYGDFFTAYVQNHSRTTASGGLLVDDYYHPNGNLPTHTSPEPSGCPRTFWCTGWELC